MVVSPNDNDQRRPRQGDHPELASPARGGGQHSRGSHYPWVAALLSIYGGDMMMRGGDGNTSAHRRPLVLSSLPEHTHSAMTQQPPLVSNVCVCAPPSTNVCTSRDIIARASHKGAAYPALHQISVQIKLVEHRSGVYSM
jgi:hypothetical protein